MKRTLLIIGASYAGVQIAASARAMGYDERIVMVGEEAHLPYQRPPLSKGQLAGKTALDQLALRGTSFYDDQAIELMQGRRASALSLAEQCVTLDDGAAHAYDWLAITTGARARALTVPGAALDGVMAQRTLDDALRIAAVNRTRHVCVVGGGFVGIEVASALAARGAMFTV